MSESTHWSVKYCHMDKGELMKRIHELEAECALILATKAKQNTFWGCKDHKFQSTLRCAICDEERIAELERKNVLLAWNLDGLKAQLAEANDEIVGLHNPHTGNECDCDLCNSYGKRGER